MTFFHRRSVLISGAAVLMLPASLRLGRGASAATGDQTLTMAVVGSDPKGAMPKVEAMATYLAESLRGAGISDWKAIVASDNAEIMQLLRSGEVDLVSQTAFSAMQYVTEAGAEILAREWKAGVEEYRTLFVTRKDGPIQSILDLKGKRLAVEDSGSTTGFLLPMSILLDQGLVVEETRIGQPAHGDAIAYSFVDNEMNIAALVARGVVDAGVINNLDWDDIGDTPGPLKEQLRVFAESKPLVRSLILARGDLPVDLKARIKAALFAMHESQAGKSVLKTYYKVAKYDEMPAQSLEQLEGIGNMLPKLRELIE